METTRRTGTLALAAAGLALIAGASGGCFNPDYGDGGFRCGEDNRCPEGYACVPVGPELRCVREGTSPPPADGSPPPPVDGAPDQGLPGPDLLPPPLPELVCFEPHEGPEVVKDARRPLALAVDHGGNPHLVFVRPDGTVGYTFADELGTWAARSPGAPHVTDWVAAAVDGDNVLHVVMLTPRADRPELGPNLFHMYLDLSGPDSWQGPTLLPVPGIAIRQTLTADLATAGPAVVLGAKVEGASDIFAVAGVLTPRKVVKGYELTSVCKSPSAGLEGEVKIAGSELVTVLSEYDANGPATASYRVWAMPGKPSDPSCAASSAQAANPLVLPAIFGAPAGAPVAVAGEEIHLVTPGAIVDTNNGKVEVDYRAWPLPAPPPLEPERPNQAQSLIAGMAMATRGGQPVLGLTLPAGAGSSGLRLVYRGPDEKWITLDLGSIAGAKTHPVTTLRLAARPELEAPLHVAADLTASGGPRRLYHLACEPAPATN